MTLAAAYRVGETPVLLADFAMSGGSGPHIAVPSLVDLGSVLPPEWQTRISGLTRKTVQVSDNLVVAFAGSGLSARQLAVDLMEGFHQASPDLESLESFLRNCDYARSTATQCVLVGWLIDGEPRSFRWRSANPEVLEWDGDFIEGSGADLFRQIAWRPDQAQWKLQDGYEHPLRYCLEQIATLLTNEVTNGASLFNLFGVGYDLFLWDGGRFRRPDAVTFLFLTLEGTQGFTADEVVRNAAPILLKYAVAEHCTVVRGVIPPENQLGLPYDRRERTAIVPPLAVPQGELALDLTRDWDQVPLFSDPLMIIVTGPGPNGQPWHLVEGVRGEEARAFHVVADAESGKVRFYLPQVVMEPLLAAIRSRFQALAR